MSLHLRNNIKLPTGWALAGGEILPSERKYYESLGAAIVDTSSSPEVARIVELAQSARVSGAPPEELEQIMSAAAALGTDLSLGGNALTGVQRIDTLAEQDLGTKSGNFAIDWTEGAGNKLVTLSGNASVTSVTLPPGDGFLQLRVVALGAYTFAMPTVQFWGDGTVPNMPSGGMIIVNLWRRNGQLYAGQWRAFTAP